MKKLLLIPFAAVLMTSLPLVHAEEHEWTNKQGKTIKAEFVSATHEAVTISMGGKSYVVQLADLSPQSRALAAKLRVQKSKAREPQNDKTPLVKTAEVTRIDLDDNETRNRIIAEAIDDDKLQKRGKKGEELWYAQNQQTPYTGWVKAMYDNGQIKGLGQSKAGKMWTAVGWKPNGEKCPHTNVVNGNGVVVSYFNDGTEDDRTTFKDGEIGED